jgi:hypothetical protein
MDNNNYDELYGGFISADLFNLQSKYRHENKLMHEIANLALVLATKIKALKKESKELDEAINKL